MIFELLVKVLYSRLSGLCGDENVDGGTDGEEGGARTCTS